jgi:GTPase SAR1 family protein
MPKTLICIVGAGASGKSTLTRALCGEGAEERKSTLLCLDHKLGTRVLEKVSYTLLPNGLAIAGNVKNGSDSISRMDALRQVVELCWMHRAVVIVDTVRATHKFVRWIHEHPLSPAALFVFLSPSLEENLDRLRERRKQRGVVESELPPRTYRNVFVFRARAHSVWDYARSEYRRQPVRFVEITEGTPEQAAVRVLEVLRELQKEAHETYEQSRTA